MRNRLGITLRLNIEEQHKMQALAAFWFKSERPNETDIKKVIKLAIEQLAIATKQLHKKLEQEKNNETTTNVDGSVSTAIDSPDNSDAANTSTGAVDAAAVG